MRKDLPVLLGADEAEEEEVAYYRQRLADPTLIRVGLAVRLGGFAFLAVPVGGRRRGGYLSVTEVVTGMAVRALLKGRAGFPDVRLRWSPWADACHAVEWGAAVPGTEDPVTLGQFYGYSAEAIGAYGA